MVTVFPDVSKKNAEKEGAALICPNCGYDNLPNAHYCTKCGKALKPGEPPAPDEDLLREEDDYDEEDEYYEPYDEEGPKHHTYAPLITLIVLLCIAGVAASFTFAWHQERGAWPWESFLVSSASSKPAAVSSSQAPLSPQKAVTSYTAAEIAAQVRRSGFQTFTVAEAEISSIKVDSQSLSDADLVQFTVNKSMAQVHMQLRVPTQSSVSSTSQSTASSQAAASSAVVSKPTVTAWGVDTWKLTGTWNDSDGNALLIDTCNSGSMTARYIPAGTVESRSVSGTISGSGDISLISSKTRLSGRFSPSGTALLTVTVNNGSPATQQFVMLSSAIATLPSASAASSASSSSGASSPAAPSASSTGSSASSAVSSLPGA